MSIKTEKQKQIHLTVSENLEKPLMISETTCRTDDMVISLQESLDSIPECVDNDTRLEYKGILFDDWTIDRETGGIWGEMCQFCAEKFADILQEELSLGGIGACSVEGCHEIGYDNDAPGHYYIDFNPSLINFVQKKRELKSDIDAQIDTAQNKRQSYHKFNSSTDKSVPERV